jgi:regulator of cell morphogenesis and NO signaling
MTSYATESLGNLVTEHPRRAGILEDFGIDYCCGGKRSLEEACDEKELDVEEVCRQLAWCDLRESADSSWDWSYAAPSPLIDDIVNVHHGYLRSELPALTELLDKVVAAHGRRHPELCEVRTVFAGLRHELHVHMQKEEQILFPWIRDLEMCRHPFSRHGHSVTNPISVMEDDHKTAGEALHRLHVLTGGYEPPDDACASYRVLLARLRELERDLHWHIHKENNVLFPMAVELERSR